jgi:hypothetical protein
VWIPDWKLEVNANKPHVLHMHTYNPQIAYYFDGIRIGSCDMINIGVDNHMSRIAAQTYSRIGSLFRGFVSRNLHVLRQA